MPGNRFYDQDKVLSRIVRLTEALPSDLQALASQVINQVAEKNHSTRVDVRSLTQNQVLALHKAMQKQREQDKSTDFHKSVNYLAVLPQSDRLNLANFVIGFIEFLSDYWEKCRFLGVMPEKAQLSKCREQFLALPSSHRDSFIQSLRKSMIDENHRFQKGDLGKPFVIDGMTIHLRDF